MKFIYFFVYLLFVFKISYSIEPPISEYNCLTNIVTKYSISAFPKNSSDQYIFCQNGVNICDPITGSIKRLKLNGPGNNPNKLNSADLSCLNFEELEINYLDISPNLIYYKFPNCKRISFYSTNGITSFTQPFPSYDYFFIYNFDLNNVVLKLSYLCQIGSIEIRGSYILLENDTDNCVDPNILNNVLIATKNIPNLTRFTFLKNVTLYFDIDFDKNSIENFSTIIATNVYLSHLVTSITTPFYVDKNMKIENLIFNGALERPSSVINLSGNANYKTLTILGSGSDFNLLNGDFPVKVNNNVTFTFYNGNVSKIPDLSQFGFRENSVNISFSIKNGNSNLDKFNGFGYSYDLSNNRLIGTLDESFCNTEVNLYLNQLTGSIPSCFSCYLKSKHTGFLGNLPVMKQRFLGNSFANLDENLPCPLFQPRVEVVADYSIKVYGVNIGYDSNNWLIQDSIFIDSCIPTIFGKEYYCNIPKLVNGFKNLTYFSVLFKLPSNNSYTFPVSLQTPPIIDSVKISENTLVITGSFFSSYKGYTTQLVTSKSGTNCTVTSVDFFNILCTFQSNIEFTGENFLIISTNNLKSSVIINYTADTLNNQKCPNDCSLNGVCNLYNGTCVCFEGYGADDCSSKLCSGWCENGGQCDFQYGICECALGFSGEYCTEIVPVPCPIGLDSLECSGHGKCDNRTGECHCDENKTLKDCSLSCAITNENECIPYHYINSIDPSTSNGGEAIFGGWFNDVHVGLFITIGGLNCSIIFISNDTIKVIAPPGNGIKTVVIYQNGIEFKTDLYKYRIIEQQCPSKCSNNGQCNTSTGQCKCNTGYSSYDCSIKDSNEPKPSTNTTIDPSTGGTNWINQEIQFKVYFKSLIEIDYNGNKIKEYQLENNWNLNYSDSNIYQFKQIIQRNSLDNNNNSHDNCFITSKIEEIVNKNGKEFEFGNENFKLEYGSIKFTISIFNYKYENNLNSLKLELISTVNQNDNDNNDDQQNQSNQCNLKSTEINTNDFNDLSNFNYIKISKNNKILSARFINKAISDGKITFLNTQVLKEQDKDDNIKIILSLPHCNNLIIDPDFSLLIDNQFKSSCNGGDNSKKKWLIPVIICSVVGCAIIATITLYIYRKKFIEGEFKKKLKQLKLSKLSKK